MKFLYSGFLLVMIIFLSSCGKDELDFSNGDYYEVKDVIDSANCDADCGQIADCEGEVVMVRGKLDAGNINASNDQFYLIDANDEDKTMEVKVMEDISEAVFQKLLGNGGEIFKINGELEGFDAPTNLNCQRMFFLKVNDASHVEIE